MFTSTSTFFTFSYEKKFTLFFHSPVAGLAGVAGEHKHPARAAQSNTPPGPPQVPLGAAARYALLSGGTIQANCVVRALGRVGAADTLHVPALYVSDTSFALGGGNVSQALTDLAAARSYCSNLSSTSITTLAGQQFGGGVYSITGNATLASGDTLTLVGDTSTVVIFNISGSLTFASNSVVRLRGVQPRKVFWNIGQQLGLAGRAEISGVLMAGGAVSAQGTQTGRHAVLSVAGINLTYLLYRGEGNLFVALVPGPGDNPDPPVVPPPVTYTPQNCNLVQDGSFECFPLCINEAAAAAFPLLLPSYWSVPWQLHNGNVVPVGFYSLSYGQYITGPHDGLFNACASSLNSSIFAVPSNTGVWKGAGVPYNYLNCYGGFDVHPQNPNGSSAPAYYYPVYPTTTASLPAMAQHSTALTGSGYRSLFSGSIPHPVSGAPADVRDYLYQELRGVLQPNQRYYAEFYNIISPNSSRTAENLGLALCSATPPQRQPAPNGWGRIDLPTVVQGTPNNTYSTWRRIGGVFTASAALNHLMIGDFSATMNPLELASHVRSSQIPTNPPHPPATAQYQSDPSFQYQLSVQRELPAVYYIDNVLLAPLTEAGPNHSYCAYAPPTPLGTCPLPPQTGATYHWAVMSTTAPNGTDPTLTSSNNTLANPTVQPDYTTEYELTVTVNDATYTSRTTITITSPTLPSTPLLVNCGQPATLEVCASLASGVVYSWSTSPSVTPTGTPTNTITAYPTVATTFSVNISLPGHPRTYSLTRQVYVAPQAGPNQNVACGANAILGTCGTAAGLPPDAIFYWTVGGTTVATGLNPTVTPTAPSTIYTLMIIVPSLNQVLTAGQTTITVNGGQPCPTGCHAGSYYSRSSDYVNPYGPDYELGDASNTSSVPQIVGPVTFDGIYHVVGPVEFVGNIVLTPGTIFYVDGGVAPRPVVSLGNPCYDDVLHNDVRGTGDRYIQLFVGKGAVLRLTGATLTADCQHMWGGVELMDDGQLITEYAPDLGLRSRISEARVGVLLGTECRSTEAIYDLTSTDFYNNTYGVAVRGNSRWMQTSCRVENCHFFSDHNQRLAPDFDPVTGGNYTETGLVLRGNWHQDVVYANNQFNELYVGAELAGEGIDFNDNILASCYGAAIRVGAPDVNDYIDKISLSTNHITVPDNPQPDGQVPPGAEVRGLELMNMGLNQVLNGGLHINDNTFIGNSRNNPQKQLLGLDGYLCFAKTLIHYNNTFTTLDTGVRLTDASVQPDMNRTVADNLFSNCGQGVSLRGDTFAPIVACNSFVQTDYGVALEPGAYVGRLGDKDDYCGNGFSVLMAAVNNGSNNVLEYYHSPAENVSFVGNLVIFNSTIGSLCKEREYRYQNGLQRSAPAASISLDTVQGWQQRVLTQTGSASMLRQYERRILAYYADLEQWTALEAFVATLPLSNDAAYERLGLYLLETYRRLNQPADVQRLRTDLLTWRGSNPALRQRIAYFDVSEQLRLLLPGQRPTPADSTTLATIAASATDYAPVACATLRYFYPGVACSAATLPPPPPARPTLATSTGVMRAEKLHLSVAPNPAHEQVQLTLNVPCPSTARLELVTVGSGQLAYTQAVPAAQRSLELNVAALPPGVYAARLVGPDGQPLATAKLVIVR